MIGHEVESLEPSRRVARWRRRRRNRRVRKTSAGRQAAGVQSVDRQGTGADRLRRTERARRIESAPRHRRREIAERHRDQKSGAARRRIERHVVFGEGTRTRCGCVGFARTRERRAGRQIADRIPRFAGQRDRTRPHAESRGLSVVARTRHRCRRRVRRETEIRKNRTRRAAIEAHRRCEVERGRRLPALRRPRHRRRESDRRYAAVDDRTPTPQRHTSGEHSRRHHAIRDARTRPADARVRRGEAQRRHRSPPRAQGRKAQTARRPRVYTHA